MGISVALVSQIERGDISTQDVLNRYVSALDGTLKLIADSGHEQLKIAWPSERGEGRTRSRSKRSISPGIYAVPPTRGVLHRGSCL